MFIFPLVNGMLLLLMTRIRFRELLSLIMAMTILEIVCDQTEMASETCQDQHNALTSKITFNANCKRDGLTDEDSEDGDKHKCYMMRRYCAKQCTANAYGGECDVKSVFTLNLKVDSNGNYQTLDCVCIYHSHKIGCYNNYHIPWTTVTEEFVQECSSERATTTIITPMTTTTTITPTITTTTATITTTTTTTPTTTTTSTNSAIKILLIGGTGTAGVASMEIYYPDQPGNNHQISVPLLFPRYSHTSFVLNDQAIITVGGKSSSTSLPISDCESYNPTTNQVSQCGKLAEARSSTASAVLDGVAYVCGGSSIDNILSSCESYQSGQWQTSQQMLTARHSLAMAAFEGRIYAIGGNNNYGTTATVQQYNPSDGTWITRQEMTQNRYSHSAAVLNGVLYVCGGDSGQRLLTRCENYDSNENKWVFSITQMNRGWKYLNLVATGKRLFALGYFMKEVDKYELNEDTWIKLEQEFVHERQESSAVLLP